ncbi:hypothetical protein L9F63_011765, partial [Diploptera punctata]
CAPPGDIATVHTIIPIHATHVPVNFTIKKFNCINRPLIDIRSKKLLQTLWATPVSPYVQRVDGGEKGQG